MDDEPRASRPRTSRVARASLAAVALMLGAGALLALHSGLAYQEHVQRLERSALVVDAYLRLHEAVAVSGAIEERYRIHPTLSGRLSFRSAHVRLTEALSDLHELGGTSDRHLAAEVEQASGRYAAAMEREFELVAQGEASDALDEYDDEVVDPLSTKISYLVNAYAPVSARAAVEQIAQLRAAAGRSLTIALALVVTLAAVLVGLLAAVGIVQRRRRLVEDALDSTEHRYRLVLETGQDAYVAFAPNGAIRDWNGRAAETFGLSEKSHGLLVQDFFADQERRDDRMHDALLALNGGTKALEAPIAMSLRRADGSTFAAEVSVWSTESDGVRFFNAFVRDVETRLRLEEELRQAQKMEAVGQLAGGIAHDFNNVLTVIAGSSELARYELDDDHPARLEIDQVITATNRGAALTRQLLTFSRQRRPLLVDIDVAATIAETGELLTRLVDSRIELRIETGRDVGYVRLEEGQLDQILLNLVINARDSIADQPGSIRVDVGRTVIGATTVVGDVAVPAGDWIRLQVEDTGSGMDAATRARIFEPFFTTKPEGVGTGFGLATVYGIVTQARGQLTVSSEPGQGTTFTIYLPQADGPALTAAA